MEQLAPFYRRARPARFYRSGDPEDHRAECPAGGAGNPELKKNNSLSGNKGIGNWGGGKALFVK